MTTPWGGRIISPDIMLAPHLTGPNNSVDHDARDRYYDEEVRVERRNHATFPERQTFHPCNCVVAFSSSPSLIAL